MPPVFNASEREVVGEDGGMSSEGKKKSLSALFSSIYKRTIRDEGCFGHCKSASAY